MVRSCRLALSVLLVAGCAQSYQTFDPPPLDFTSRPPVLLRVDQVRTRTATDVPGRAGPAAALPVAPDQAVREMLDYRLRAAGGAGTVEATILEASLTERPLETQEGLRGYVVEEPVAELLGRLKVRLERLDEEGRPVGSISTAVTRSAAIPESATFVRRQEIAYELVRDLVNDLDTGLISNLQQSFPTLLAPTV